MVRHLDDQLRGHASELHVQVDELHRLAEGRTPRSREYFGEAPAQSKACDLATAAKARIRDPKFCDKYHAADPAFWKRVYYWKTPLADCGNGDDRLQGLQRLGPGLDRDQGVTGGLAT